MTAGFVLAVLVMPDLVRRFLAPRLEARAARG